MSRTGKCIPYLPNLASWFQIYMLVFAQALTVSNNPDYDPAYKDVLLGALERPPREQSKFLYDNRILMLKALKNKHRQAPSPERQSGIKAFRQLVKSMDDDR